ncbi:unnamed protein product [Cunninghamella echinulata]
MATKSGTVSPYEFNNEQLNEIYDLPNPQKKSTKKNVSTFIQKLYSMLDDNTHQNLIIWNPSGQSFSVYNAKAFSKEVLPSHFKHSNFSSFVRLLNMYGFHKINKSPRGQRSSEKEIWEFSHPKFIRGHPELLKDIKRKAMDSELMRRETGDIHAAFSMLQMSQGDLLQQFYALQESFNNLLHAFEENKKIQFQQQIQIKQLSEQQGIQLTNLNDLKWNNNHHRFNDPLLNQQQHQPQPSSTTTPSSSTSSCNSSSNSSSTLPPPALLRQHPPPSALKLSPGRFIKQEDSIQDNSFRMLVATPTTPLSHFSQQQQNNIITNNNNNNNNMKRMDDMPTSPFWNQTKNELNHTTNNNNNPYYSPLCFDTSVNTPLPPSPMNVASPDLAMSPISSEDSLGSFAFNLSQQNTLDASFM